MTYEELESIVSDVRCEVGEVQWTVQIGSLGANGYFLRVFYLERDVVTHEVEEQKGRKWYISRHSTKSEVVQTILKAALTSAEHMVREHFTYKGARIFGPHFNVDDLVELVSAKDEEHRPANVALPPLAVPV